MIKKARTRLKLLFKLRKTSRKGIAKLGRKDNITSTKTRISLSFKDHEQ
jgi:hypothetical protein